MPTLDSYVKLMCHFNGTDGSTTIVDDYSDKTITVNGNAQLDTAQKKFGTASLLLDGTGDYLSIADNADFNFGSGDFTVDCQIRINSLPGSGAYQCIFSQRGSSGLENSLGLFIRNNSGVYQLHASFSYSGTFLAERIMASNYSFAINTWYHVEICREGTRLGLFVDGNNIATYNVGSNSLYNSTYAFLIGASEATPANFFNGWIDEFRLSKGISRHTLVSYTPPTSAYTPDSYDKLLLHMDGSDDSTTFTDSATSKTVTANGDVKQKTSYLAPKIGTGMAVFDGSGDYISAPDHADWTLGSSDFTLEFWIYLSSNSGTQGLLTHRGGYSSDHGWICYLYNGVVNFMFTTNGTTAINQAFNTTLSTGTWYHLSFVRYSNTLKLYINGTAESNTKDMTGLTIYNSTAILIIGNLDGYGSGLIGKMDELRISDTARYTGNFTPSTSAFSSDSNTKLLVHFDGSQGGTSFTDSGNTGHTLTTAGNTYIDTGVVPKIGTAMAYFDGVNDYLSLADSADWAFGSGDFSIDLWYYSLAYSGDYANHEALLGQCDNYGSNHAIIIYIGPTETRVEFSYNGSTVYFIMSTEIPGLNSWNHIALQRISSTLYLMINGYIVGTYDISTNSLYNSSSELRIGVMNAGGTPYADFKGFIDEYRISKGISRFAVNSFTPPSVEYSALTAPIVTTTSPVTNITTTTVDVAGNVSSDGGATITERGFVYGTSANPTTSNNKIVLSGTTGAMSTTISGLSMDILYHVRAYAINSQGTSYGADVSFRTITIFNGTNCEVLEFAGEYEAEVGTDEGTIYITDHGLDSDDFIVNVTRRWEDAERGARLVYDPVTPGPDAFLLYTGQEINNGGIPGINYGPQTDGDTIRLYKYRDRLSIIMPGTFKINRKTAGRTEASFTIKTTNAYMLYPGNYLRLGIYDSGLESMRPLFKGLVHTARYRMLVNKSGVNELYGDITCVGYNQIPSRRTIQVAYDMGTDYGTIVEEMVDSYLFQDGVKKGTIDVGGTLSDDWYNDVISISDVLDQCAEKSGYQWFIDDNGELQFYQEPVSIPTASFALDTEGASKPFRNIEIDWTLSNYVNKVFICGGSDERGDDIIISAEDFTKSTEMQELHAGTGVYGMVNKDGSITNAEYKMAESGTTTTRIYQTNHGVVVGDMIQNYTREVYRVVRSISTNYFDVDEIASMVGTTSDTAEAGTTTTIIKMTGHTLSAGELIYNSTRSVYRTVVSVLDANTVTVEAVPSQTNGDTILRNGDIIVYYHEANRIIRNTLTKQSTRPAVLTFETNNLTLNPGEKMTVNVPEIGLNNEDFLVEEVELNDIGLNRENMWAKVRLTRRDNSNFTTQRSPNYTDFWGRF